MPVDSGTVHQIVLDVNVDRVAFDVAREAIKVSEWTRERAIAEQRGSSTHLGWLR